jgi:protein CpxP
MQTIEHEPAGENGQQTPTKSNWSKRLVIGGIAVVALAGVGVAGALSQDFGGDRMQRFGMGFGDGGPGMHQVAFRHHGPGMGMGGPGIGRILSEIDATDEQEDKIEAIMDQLHDDVRPIMRGFRDTREDLAELLGAATVDATALETMRAERLAAVDEASKKVTAALVQAAEVLTPEQRAKLKEHFEDRGGRGRW